MDPLRQARAFSRPELLVLCILAIVTALIALPAAYPYLRKAHRQATTIKQWEESSTAEWHGISR